MYFYLIFKKCQQESFIRVSFLLLKSLLNLNQGFYKTLRDIFFGFLFSLTFLFFADFVIGLSRLSSYRLLRLLNMYFFSINGLGGMVLSFSRRIIITSSLDSDFDDNGLVPLLKLNTTGEMVLLRILVPVSCFLLN